MNLKIEFFPDEQPAVLELISLAEDLLELRPLKPPKVNPESGKHHFYLESKDHKKRTNQMHKG